MKFTGLSGTAALFAVLSMVSVLVSGCSSPPTTPITSPVSDPKTQEALDKAAKSVTAKEYSQAILTLSDAMADRVGSVVATMTPAPEDDEAKKAEQQRSLASDGDVVKMEEAELRITLLMGQPAASSKVLGDLKTGMPDDHSLADLLKDPDPDVRRGVIDVYGLQGTVADVPVIRSALSDTDPKVRRKAADALGGLKDEGSLDGLIPALKDSDAIVRSNAADSLGRIRNIRAIVPLVDALADSDESVALAAETSLLVLIREPGVKADPFVARMNDSNTRVSLVTASCAIMLGDNRAVPSLIGLAKSTDPRIKLYALKALGESNDPRAIPILHDALNSTVEDEVGWSVISLGQLKDQTAIPALKQLAISPKSTPAIRQAALDALYKIEGPQR